MALTKLDKNLNIVSALDSEPNDVGGLTSEELKAKFDEGGKAIQEYINETLIPETEAAVEEVRGEIAGAVDEATKNLESQLRGVVLGQIPNGTITEEKLDPAFVDSRYTKTETLTNDTKALFGLGSGAVPNDVLNVLSKTLVTGERTVQTEVMFEPWRIPAFVDNMYAPIHSLICIDDEFYIAAGTSCSLYHSKDGTKWSRLSNIHSDSIASLRYINGNLIATHGDRRSTSGMRYSYVSVSKDMGATWEHNSVNINGNWVDIAYGNGVYVMVANCDANGSVSYLATSTDLKTWTLVTLPRTDNWNTVLFGNGKFVVYGNAGLVLYSTDGTTWTDKLTTHNGYSWGGAFGNGVFVMGGGGVGGQTVVSASTDGINWTQTTVSTSDYISNFTFVDGYFYALSGAVRQASVGKVYRSADGLSWELISTADLPSYKWVGLAYSPQKETFVCLREEGSNGVYYTRNAYDVETTLSDIKGEKTGGLSLVQRGSYVGAGSAGSANANVLTFEFKPELVFIASATSAKFHSGNSDEQDWRFFIRGMTAAKVKLASNNSSDSILKIEWNDNGLSWYHTNDWSGAQLNNSGVEYYYIAFGG